MAYWFSFAAVAGAFGGLIAFGIQHVHASIANWRLLFIIEVSTINLSPSSSPIDAKYTSAYFFISHFSIRDFQQFCWVWHVSSSFPTVRNRQHTSPKKNKNWPSIEWAEVPLVISVLISTRVSHQKQPWNLTNILFPLRTHLGSFSGLEGGCCELGWPSVTDYGQ